MTNAEIKTARKLLAVPIDRTETKDIGKRHQALIVYGIDRGGKFFYTLQEVKNYLAEVERHRKINPQTTTLENFVDSDDFLSNLPLEVKGLIKAFHGKRPVAVTRKNDKYHYQHAFAAALALLYHHFNNGEIPIQPY